MRDQAVMYDRLVISYVLVMSYLLPCAHHLCIVAVRHSFSTTDALQGHPQVLDALGTNLRSHFSTTTTSSIDSRGNIEHVRIIKKEDEDVKTDPSHQTPQVCRQAQLLLSHTNKCPSPISWSDTPSKL